MWRKEFIIVIRGYIVKDDKEVYKAVLASGNGPRVSVGQHSWQWGENLDMKQRGVTTNWNPEKTE